MYTCKHNVCLIVYTVQACVCVCVCVCVSVYDLLISFIRSSICRLWRDAASRRIRWKDSLVYEREGTAL